MQKSKVTLIEDSQAFRKVIERTFKSDPSLEIISQFATAEGALRSLQNLTTRENPDIILLDLNLPGMSGIEALPWLQKELPDTKIIVLTQSGREADVLGAIQSGASGYLLKNSTLKKLKEAIQDVLNGGRTIDPAVAKFILRSVKKLPSIDSEPEIQLTPREKEILTLTAEGLVKKEVACKLDITHRTVATHIEHIYKKLNVKNAAAAIHKAHRTGLFPNDQ